jgi:hypothetical protein
MSKRVLSATFTYKGSEVIRFQNRRLLVESVSIEVGGIVDQSLKKVPKTHPKVKQGPDNKFLIKAFTDIDKPVDFIVT